MTPEDTSTTVLPPAADPAPPVEPPAPNPVPDQAPPDPLLGQAHEPAVLFTEDMDHQQDVAQQVTLATGPWSIKPQEVVDKHSGLTVTFGCHADDSNTVFMILSHKGLGSLLTFHRDGDILKCQAIPAPTDAQKQAMAEAAARQVPNVHTADPADTGSSAALEKTQGEQWRDNPHAPPGTNVKPGTTPLPDNGLPATPGA